MVIHLLAIETGAENTSGFTLIAERFLQEFALILKVILEFVAILLIAIALLKYLQKFWHSQRLHQSQMAQPSIRLELGLSLALSLKFLLAVDIVGTAVSPHWDAVAKLAAITGIRTFLNFFLQREVRELQSGMHPLSKPHP
jgi:uncharacterized membrane protein